MWPRGMPGPNFSRVTIAPVHAANRSLNCFAGYTKDEIVGRHFSTFYGQEDKKNDKPGRELADALRDGRVEDEGWRYRKV
jgi:osomolarity two-component system, sensor histidine kinase TcsA